MGEEGKKNNALNVSGNILMVQKLFKLANKRLFKKIMCPTEQSN